MGYLMTFFKSRVGVPSMYVYRYKLCGGGVETLIWSVGGVIQSLKAPNKDGELADIVLGYDTPKGEQLWIPFHCRTPHCSGEACISQNTCRIVSTFDPSFEQKCQ